MATVNSWTLSPGDSILFQRGGTWKGRLNLDTKHGSFLKPIYVGADTGSGPLPLITTRDTITGWSSPFNWVEDQPNVWRFTPVSSTSLSYDNPHFYTKRIWLADILNPEGVEYPMSLNSSLVSSHYRYSWTADNTGLFWVYSVGNPSTYYTSIEHPGNEDGTITLYGSSYFKIQNLDLRGSEGGCIDIAASTNKIEIRNCNIGRDTGHDGIRLFGRCDSIDIVSNRIIAGQTAQQYMYNAVYIGNGIGMYTGAHDIRVDSNLVADWFHSCIEVSDIYSLTDDGGIRMKNGYSVSNISIKYNKMSGANSSYCRGIGLDAYGYHKPYKIFCGYNRIDSMTARSQMELDSGVFVYNVISNTRNHGLQYAFVNNSGQGFMATGYNGTFPQNMLIANNTIYNCEEAGICLSSSDGYIPTRKNLIANNLIYNCGTVGQDGLFGYQFVCQILTGGSIDSNTLKNNLIYKAGVTTPFYDNQRPTGQQALTIDLFNASSDGATQNTVANNRSADPLLNSSTDPYLQAGSPAINHGLALDETYLLGLQPGSSWPSSIQRGAQGSFWNIGAYILSAIVPVNSIRIPRKIKVH